MAKFIIIYIFQNNKKTVTASVIIEKDYLLQAAEWFENNFLEDYEIISISKL